jgi:hypothetical protein
MATEELEKYLHYLAGEIDRYLNDGQVTDNEMIQFINEWNSFKNKVDQSLWSEALKNRFHELDFRYSVKTTERGFVYFLMAFLTLGLWALVLRYRNNRNRIFVLGGLRNDLNRIFIELKLS